MPDGQTITDKDRLDLYRMEYEQCVSSYQNIYEAIWRIFSYLSAVTAGLLVLGTQHLSLSAAVTVAMVPLLFWFFAVYLPMDKYGNQRCDRLAKIEETVNEKFGVELKHFTILAKRSGLRVKHGVCVFAGLLFLTFVLSLCQAVRTGFTRAKDPARFEGKVEVSPPFYPPPATPTPK